MKRRLLYLAIALSVIPIGLIVRLFRGDADASTPFGFIATYLPDTLWAVMFFFLFAVALPRWKAWQLGLLTLVFTISIEVSQLYHGEPLTTLRDFPPTGFLLGSNFLWSDVICLTIGSGISIGLHRMFNRPQPTLVKG